MSTAFVWASVIVIIIAVLVLALPWLLPYVRRLALARDALREGAHPVFSAETAAGREAEYLNDRLPSEVPRWAKFVAFFLLIVAGTYLVVVQWVAH